MRKKYQKSPSLSTELKEPPHSMPGEALSISPSVKSGVMVKQPTSPSLIHSNNSHYGKCKEILDIILRTQQEYLVKKVGIGKHGTVCTVLDSTVMMCTWHGQVGDPICLMECAFVQSDQDVMQKLNSYVQDIPSLLIVRKLVIKQGQQYHSLGSKASAAPQLWSSDLMMQRQWTDCLGEDEFEQVIYDGHMWLLLSSVEIHIWTHQAGNSRIKLSDTDGNGYAFGVYDINHAFQCGLELIKQEVLMVLESVNAD
ncbi:hypothetical protein EDC04DRAFT_2985323 [Pisolithus marmoratus]|nr:hypothetical protein EDC04DRAFT_2985323 [Pisolithus marmoratus]